LSKRSVNILRIVFVAILSLQLSISVFGSRKPEKIILHLSWKHQFQFAGYYAAVEKGFYSQLGLNVEIKQAEIGVSNISEVLKGNSHFGIGNAELIAHYMDGMPIVLVAAIFQHSPSTLITKKSSNVNSPDDLRGKKIMLNEFSVGTDVMAMLIAQGLKQEDIEMVPSSLSLNDLLNDRVLAYHGYTSNEPYFMDKFGIPYNTINPSDFGFDFYSDCIFSSQKFVNSNPEIVARFREASVKGWEYAILHKDEMANIIASRYNSSKTIDHLLFEAKEIERLINPELIEIGHSNRERWYKIAEQLYQVGIIKRIRNIDDFIYKPSENEIIPWVKFLIIVISIAALLILSYFLIKNWVQRAVNTKRALVDSLEKQIRLKEDEIQRLNLEIVSTSNSLEERDIEREAVVSRMANELKALLSQLLISLEGMQKDRQFDGNLLQTTDTIRLLFITINGLVALNQAIAGKGQKFCTINIDDTLREIAHELKANNKSVDIKVKTIIPFPEFLTAKDLLLTVVNAIIDYLVNYGDPDRFEVQCFQDNPELLHFSFSVHSKKSIGNILKQLESLILNNDLHNIDASLVPIYTASRMARLSNGSLWVESGDSAMVTLNLRFPCLPIENSNESTMASLPVISGIDGNELAHLKGKTILIMDTHRKGYMLIKTMLNGFNCRVIYSPDIQTTLGIISCNCHVDAILVSFSVLSTAMADGVTVIRKVKPHVPIIAIVGFDFDSLQSQSANWFCAIIKKPLSQGQLLQTLLECFKVSNKKN
jgi:ABC-type nitrate/sulfonate/bicarbonate transport system substrate-binding protein